MKFLSTAFKILYITHFLQFDYDVSFVFLLGWGRFICLEFVELLGSVGF